MKYPNPKKQEKRDTCSCLISDFMYGINDDTGEMAAKGDMLKDCVNMEYIGKTLLTRRGFKAKDGYIVSPGEYDECIYLPFTVTNTAYYVNNVPKNLAYYCSGYADAATLYFFLVDSAGNISPAGSIEFIRVDAEHFFVPKNVFFMVAQKKRGNGVFAFVYKESGEESICEAFEAQEGFYGWINVDGSYYVPTVLIYGRGEQYDLSQLAERPALPEPQRLEELNLLSGKYKCYFTSDDFSSFFRLPYGNIPDASSFACRVYTDTDTYTTWLIGPFDNHRTATFLGETVDLFLDRQTGMIHFYKGTTYYEIPRMERCAHNNIVVTASVEENDFYHTIVTSKGTVALDNRIYCFGGDGKSNCIFCSKADNPFYFPQSSKLFLGDGTTPVTSLNVQNGKLIAFKPGETYRVITSAENEEGRIVDLPEATAYIKGDMLSAQTIDNNIGCAAPETLRLCGNRLAWLGSDGNIYALATTTYGNTTNIFRVSQPLGNRLKEALKNAERVFAVTNGGQYLLFVDKTVFVMNHRVRGFGYLKTYYAHDDDIKSPAWYIWKLPESISYLGGAVVNGQPVLVSRLGEELCFYTSVIDGKFDTHLIRENGETVSVNTPFSSSFTTKLFDCDVGPKPKSLLTFLLSAHGRSLIKLRISDGKKSFSQEFRIKDDFDFVPILCGIPKFKRISVSFSSDDAMYIESIFIVCKLLAGAG